MTEASQQCKVAGEVAAVAATFPDRKQDATEMNLRPANETTLVTPLFTAYSPSADLLLAADNDNPPPLRVNHCAVSPAAPQGMVTAVLRQIESGAATTNWVVICGGRRSSTCTATLTKRRLGGAL